MCIGGLFTLFPIPLQLILCVFFSSCHYFLVQGLCCFFSIFQYLGVFPWVCGTYHLDTNTSIDYIFHIHIYTYIFQISRARCVFIIIYFPWTAPWKPGLLPGCSLGLDGFSCLSPRSDVCLMSLFPLLDAGSIFLTDL